MVMTTTEVPTRSQMIRLLQKGCYNVKFRKADGTTRTIYCTLQEDSVPVYDGKPGGENRDVVNVWDLHKNAWRAYRVDSVKTFKFVV